MPTEFHDLVAIHAPCAIHDKAGYDNALELVEALAMLPKRTRGQSEYLDTLSILIEAYEAEAEPIDDLFKPIDILRRLMEEHSMSASDLGRLLGERTLGPKVLSGQRGLSKVHIRKLAAHFKLPADVFL